MNESLIKFIILLVLFILYYFYISTKIGFKNGIHSIILTWCSLVLCTPLSDAGFIIDFPLILFFNIPMVITQLFVFFLSIVIVLFYIFYSNLIEHFKKTFVLKNFYKVLSIPYPWYFLILISQIGTFASVKIYDTIYFYFTEKNKKKNPFLTKKFIIVFSIFILSWIIWYFITKSLLSS